MARISNTKILNEIKNFRASQDTQIDALESLSMSLSEAQKTTESFKDNLTSLNNLIDSMIDSNRKSDIERAERDRASRIREDSDKISSAMKQLTSRFIDLAKIVADTANRYSQISNDLITVTGASGRDVRETRAEIVQDIIRQINKETGNFLNPEKSYQRVVDIANQANIGNLEAIESITRPMLIASETMNIKNDELASLFNKWYTRYNFSTVQMEDMVDEIRGNTAGNNATAASAMENISKFQNFIGVYADSTEEMQNMVEAISQESSRLESVGINSGYIFDYMKQIGIGDISNATTILSLLENSGTGMDWTEAQRLLRSGEVGDMKLVSEALVEGARAIGEKFKDSTVTAESLKVYGLDIEEIYNILSASGILMNSDEFMNSVSGAQSAIESLDDKFNTYSDKLGNIFSGISEHFAKFQEILSVGMSDILQTLGLIYAAIQVRNVLNNRGSGLGTPVSIGSRLRNSRFGVNQWVNTTMAGEAMGLSGTAATVAGSALTLGGVAAGGALAWDGVKTLVDDGADKTEKVWAGVEAAGGVAGVAGLVALGATNPVGWVALAIGGLGFLGKKAYENAHALSGNAEKISSEIETIGDSLKKENQKRIDQLSDLTYQFNTSSTLEEKQNAMLASGLFTKEDLQGKEESQLKAMIDSYKNAAIAMDDITDSLIKKAKENVSKKADIQQSDFIEDLYDSVNDLSDREREQVLKYLMAGTTDEKLLKNSEKALKDDKVTTKELKQLLKSGKHNYLKQDLDISSMMKVGGYLDWDDVYTDYSANLDSVLGLTNALEAAMTAKAFDDIVTQIENAGLTEDVEDLLGSDIYTYRDTKQFISKEEEKEIIAKWIGDNINNAISNYREKKQYASGSNYIESDQTARIHEGEAVVPKKYNPSANVTELEMLRRYYRESNNRENEESLNSMREIVSAIREIREFLLYWKEDNNKREDINKSASRLSANADYISRYMPGY